MTAKVSPVELLDAESAPLLARRFFEAGDPGPIVAALAHVPELLEVTLPFVGVALSPGGLDTRTKEFVVLRTSVILGCRYCVDAHTVVALDSGLSRSEVDAVRGAHPVSLPDQRVTVSLAWVDAVAGERGPIPSELTARLRGAFAEYEIVELAVVIGATMFLNRFCTALELPSSAATLQRLAEEGYR